MDPNYLLVLAHCLKGDNAKSTLVKLVLISGFGPCFEMVLSRDQTPHATIELKNMGRMQAFG